MMKKIGIILCVLSIGCAAAPQRSTRVPSAEYAHRVKAGGSGEKTPLSTPFTSQNAAADPVRARISYAQAAMEPEFSEPLKDMGAPTVVGDRVTNLTDHASSDPSVRMYENPSPNTRDYNGPLSLGDPGVSASLWRESSSRNFIFQDHRAFQPMDLITIVVTEKSKGSKDADTDVKTESSLSAAIEKFIGAESYLAGKNPSVDPTNLISAETKSEFKGEGETTRSGSLTAKISAMVIEVLPSGILRIEGEKIISVNSEEEVMVISGLIRTTDINSANEVDSSKVANMRIDYYGSGTVGDVQHGGWMGRVIRRLWPF